ATYDPHTPPLNAMALGFYQQNEAGLRAIGHGGDTIFFHSDMHLFLDKGVGLFVSVNSAGSVSGLGTLLLRGELASTFAERDFSETALQPEETLPTAQEHGEKIAGVYEVSRSAITNFLTMTRFLGQMKVTVSEEGELLVPFAGGVTRWREVEPFVWRKKDSWERLSATFDENGRVDQLSFEPFSPFMTYSPAPWYRSSALLSPLLGLALGALALTALFWPVRAIVRWRYKTAFALTGKEAFGYRFARVAAVAVLAYLGAWAALFTALQADLSTLTPAFDGNVRIMQVAQIVLYIGLAATLWNAMLVWRGAGSWLAKVWSLVIPAAIAVVIWMAAIGGLLSFSLTY
ncbi:MAG: hypothetical protein RIE56_05130, partial [Amphiplicatus sp.]